MASKSQLNLLLQKCRLDLPKYTSTKSADGFFTSEVSANGATFRSHEGGKFSKKAEAENDAAREALSAALERLPAGASDLEGLLRWLDDPANRKTWRPFEGGGPLAAGCTQQSFVAPAASSAPLRSGRVEATTVPTRTGASVADPPINSPPPSSNSHPPSQSASSPTTQQVDCCERLKEFCRTRRLPEPKFNVHQRSGRAFVAEVEIGDVAYGPNWTSSSLKDAKEVAAVYTLGILENSRRFQVSQEGLSL